MYHGCQYQHTHQPLWCRTPFAVVWQQCPVEQCSISFKISFCMSWLVNFPFFYATTPKSVMICRTWYNTMYTITQSCWMPSPFHHFVIFTTLLSSPLRYLHHAVSTANENSHPFPPHDLKWHSARILVQFLIVGV